MALMQYQGQGVQYQYNGQYNVPGGHPAGGDDDDDDDNDDDGLPAYSHHDKIPPWWEYGSNDKVGNVSVSKSHYTW